MGQGGFELRSAFAARTTIPNPFHQHFNPSHRFWLAVTGVQMFKTSILASELWVHDSDRLSMASIAGALGSGAA